ncbi:cupin domain-containing protein [Lacrimispora sp. BS-2]|uniref:Cupin domain-containing protein n=1 Tax=Lacrimispora sp. BS-2 TaxID=3151850 RepID=A0AAU7PK57_9FIRM
MMSYSCYVSHSNCVSDNAYLTWDINDYGPAPLVLNIVHDTLRNPTFLTTRWTGDHMQLALMSIPVNGETGLGNNPELDQFIRIESGEGLLLMGDSPYNLTFQEPVNDKCAIIIPANTWYNLKNTGEDALKLFTIYSPVVQPSGTVHWRMNDLKKGE